MGVLYADGLDSSFLPPRHVMGFLLEEEDIMIIERESKGTVAALRVSRLLRVGP